MSLCPSLATGSEDEPAENNGGGSDDPSQLLVAAANDVPAVPMSQMDRVGSGLKDAVYHRSLEATGGGSCGQDKNDNQRAGGRSKSSGRRCVAAGDDAAVAPALRAVATVAASQPGLRIAEGGDASVGRAPARLHLIRRDRLLGTAVHAPRLSDQSAEVPLPGVV